LLVSGQAVSSVGSQVSLAAFPLLVLALTNSPAQAGLMTALRGLPFALFCLPAGALIDRWDRKRVMILCDIGRAIALGSIPVAVIRNLAKHGQAMISVRFLLRREEFHLLLRASQRSSLHRRCLSV
jgi:MFS family permease